ncbi:unnamed protein product [Cuscuta epithymum]|uniref:Uncharacterized protein n=1 Tax=Cuscuta epithymum TaxID=186058 RepID=A0AAV0DXL1_9ASTE|nr:unnamed protein product [Cuscuta epithymum]
MKQICTYISFLKSTLPTSISIEGFHMSHQLSMMLNFAFFKSKHIRCCVLLIGVIDMRNFRCAWLAKLFQHLHYEASIIRHTPEPPPHYGKKKMLNWISFFGGWSNR